MKLRIMILTLAICGCVLALTSTGRLLAGPQAAGNRAADPIVLSGAELPDLIGVPVTDVVAYRYSGSVWEPIPFQVDEKTIEADDTEPDYVAYEDGVFDLDDEIALMAADAGVATSDWPDDAEARQHNRVHVAIIDPLTRAAAGDVYLFRSTTLARNPAVYVTWDAASETVSGISYTLSFDSNTLLGIDSLMLNGQAVDIIDRQKVRINARVFGFPLLQTEEDLAADFDPAATLVIGPVRLVEGGDFGAAYYGMRFDSEVLIDIEAIEADLGFGANIERIRVSLDQNSPATTGIVDYFDSNGVAATIDGAADAAVTTQLRDWYQVSGGASGGLLLAMPIVNLDSGTLSTYYEDDGTIDGSDTGDERRYADTGVVADAPGGNLELRLIAFPLPPNTAASVGANYYQQVTMPLQTTATGEAFTPPTAVTLAQLTASLTSPALLPLLLLLLSAISAVLLQLRRQR